MRKPYVTVIAVSFRLALFVVTSTVMIAVCCDHHLPVGMKTDRLSMCMPNTGFSLSLIVKYYHMMM